MLGNQQREIGIFRLQGGILIAVTIDGYDAVGVLIDHRTFGIHAEGAHLSAVGLGAVYDLAFVKLIGQVGKHRRRQLHTHADIHPVGS